MARDNSTQNKNTKNTSKRQNNKKDEKKIVNNNEVKVATVKENKEIKKPIPVIKKVEKKDGGNVLERIDDNRKAIISGVVCFLLATLLFRCILWPDRIATLKDGTQPVATIDGTIITADDLYEDMKEVYSVNYLLNRVDRTVLDKIYPDTDELKDEVIQQAENYYSMYESYYGYTKEEFLNYNGFADENAFIEYLTLDKKRNDYYEEYVEGLIKEKEIEKYYKDEVYGDVDTKHILVNVKKSDDGDGLTEEDAEKMAKEIIKKLDKGTSWEDIIKEYKDNITDEELGYQAFNASLEASYLEEMKSLKVGTYSKTPVKTSYGYHVVYKIDQKDKPELDEVKDDIIDILAGELKSEDTENKLYTEALTKMREEYKLEFSDTKFAEEYKDSIK